MQGEVFVNSNQGIQSYRDLKVWQLGMEIVERSYQLTKSFPREEVYGLSSQLRRAAVSIPANIAEGHARAFTKEFLKFLSIAVGSLAKVETYLDLSIRLNYCQETEIRGIVELAAEERRMLRGLQRALRARMDGARRSSEFDPAAP